MVQIVFLHPDLGIGGAERLVVDAALALKSKGHRVSFLTSHHDKAHSFEETKDGTFSVTVVGDWIPRNLFGRFHAVFAYLRMMFMALYLLTISKLKPKVVFCDQISACIPILKLNRNWRVLFYCHFPDQLLAKGRDSALKRFYRKPIDWLEEKTTGMADFLLVNSHFTARIFRDTFTSLKSLETHVLYPSLNTEVFDRQEQMHSSDKIKDKLPRSATCVFLSINRFERKKNLPLAIHALSELRELSSDEDWESTHLILAGGYDPNLAENVEHLQELEDLTDKLDLKGKISFFKSVSTPDKLYLLKLATAIIYTPSNEHFGIVPVESMYMQRPVIAMKSGGPLETIEDGKTGFLCAESPDSVAEAMIKFVRDSDLSKTMGAAGKDRVQQHFSFDAFATSLNGIILSIL